MRLGLYFNSPETATEEGMLSRFAVEAESLGYDCLLFAEPVMVNEAKRTRAHTFVQQLTEQTSTIRLGLADSVIALEDPMSVSERIISAHERHKNRNITSVAVGEYEEAFFANDIPFEQCRDRFDETLDIVAKRFSGKTFDHSGKHFNIGFEDSEEAVTAPTMWVTARDFPTLSSAAYRGYSTIPHILSEQRVVVELCNTFTGMLIERGQDIDALERPIARDIFIANTNIEAENRALHAYMAAYKGYAENCELIDFKNRPKFPDACSLNNVLKHHLIIGDVDSVVEQLHGLINDTQCTQVIARMHHAGIEEQHVLESASLFANQVLPALETHHQV